MFDDATTARSRKAVQQGVDLDAAAKKAARLFNVGVDKILMKSRIQRRSDARGLYCYWAVNELGHSLSDLARQLKMTPAGVGYAVRRGEALARAWVRAFSIGY